MKSPLDRFNLRPFEKRVVVVIAAVLFVVFNAWFVFPHFSDWGKVQKRMEEARYNLSKYQRIIAEKPGIQIRVDGLQSQGLSVPAEDQANQFNNTILVQARQSGVEIINTGRIIASTNQFFLERTQSIGVQPSAGGSAGEQQLVNFLYNLGSGDSLIRVSDLTLRPDPSRQKLTANVRLIASYQKKTSARPAAAAARKVAANFPAQPDASGSQNVSLTIN